VVDTFLINADELEQLAVLSLVDKGISNEFSEAKIAVVFEEYGVPIKLKQIQRLCINLEMANVIERCDKHLCFTYPSLPVLLKRHYDLPFMIRQLKKEVIGK
jgi:hypothetical protein